MQPAILGTMRTPMSDKKQFAVVMLISALFVAWILYSSFEVVLITQRLQDDPELAAYPYQFRVLKSEGVVAVMSTLRSHELPTLVALRSLHPELADLSADSPEVLKAEHLLAKMQARAQRLVLEDETYEFVRWELDENWLRQNGIDWTAFSETPLRP